MATPLRLQLEILASGAGATVGELRRIREESARATTESRQSTSTQQQGNTLLGGGIAELAFRYNNVVGALQNLRATAQPVYDALIASNEQLNAQILSSQTNLASSTRLFKGEQEITDPTAKIQASAGALRSAIKQIEIDTQSLVGVTSAQVNELFQITLTNAGALNNQSKQFPDAIAAATSLTKGWAASLKVVGIPLVQARQEINSIIKGQITQDSLLAKNLNITNQQVESWRSQGRLVDELNKRLEVFVAGNGIAARSIEGISSNILDLSERISRNIGEPFLEPTINALAEIERYLKSSERAIAEFFAQLSDEIIRQGGTIAGAFAPLGKTLLEIGADLGPIALSAIKGILSTLAGVAQVVAPLANLLAGVAAALADFAATDLGGIVVQTGAVIFALTQLSTIVTGLAVAAMPALATATLTVISNMLLLQQSIAASGVVSVAATAGMGLLSGALKLLAAEAIALNAALIPLTAAIALTVLVRTTNDLEDANNALEAYGEQVLTTASAVGDISTELNRYNKIVKEGGTLTAEQITRQKQLKASAQAQSEGIQEQIKIQKELTNLNADQARQRDNNIKQLQALIEKLDKAAGGLKIESILLEDLGTTAELATKKLADFNRQIDNDAGGEKGAFEAALKGKISLIQSEVNLKRLSVEEARKELEAVRDNTKAELEIRNSAKEAIDKLYDGRIAKVKELIEVGKLETGSALDELAKIRDDATLEASTRRKASQQIVSIRKEQLAAESAAIAAGQADIAARQSQQRIGEARADEEATRLKLAEVAKRIEGIKAAEENATSDVERAKLKAEREKEAAELEKIDAELAARRRKRAIEDFDERRNLIKAQNDLGLIDRGNYNRQVLLNDIAQTDLQIAQAQEALGKLAASDREGREALNAQIAQAQSKRVEIARAYDEADLKRQKEYYDQELTALEGVRDQRLITESEYNQAVAQNRIQQAREEVIVARRQLERLGANDIEGRNAIIAKINEAEGRKLSILQRYYAAQLLLEKDRADKALAIVNESEQERAIALQKLVNDRLITQEVADAERSRSTLARQRVELQAAKDFEAELAKIANVQRTPEAEREYQRQVREARAKTLAATLSILEREGVEQERLRNLALKGLEDEIAARARVVDVQLSQLAEIREERERGVRSVEALSAREVQAIEIANKALDRQNALFRAKADLQRATSDANTSGADLELQRANRALEIRKQLDSGANLSAGERNVLERQLADLAGSSSISQIALTDRKIESENRLAAAKKEAILFEQSAARSQLAFDQQRNDMANQRAIIEARIAEFKAKQGVLDAQDNVRTTERTNFKAIEIAQLALTQAQELRPGRERDRAVADARSRLEIAEREAATNAANAAQGVDLARQLSNFATQNKNTIVEQVKSQEQIKQLQIETLDRQQKTVLEQFKAAEGARQWANELERAKAAAGSSPTTARPTVDGSAPIVRERILSNLDIAQPSLNVATSNNISRSNREVVEAVKSLEATIKSRPPTPILANFSAPDDGGMDKLFALQRSSLRIT